MYQLKLTAQAVKECKNIKQKYQQALAAAFEEISENPLAGKALKRQLSGKYSYRVGAYRIIYKVNKRDKIVHILTAGNRSDVYK